MTLDLSELWQPSDADEMGGPLVEVARVFLALARSGTEREPGARVICWRQQRRSATGSRASNSARVPSEGRLSGVGVSHGSRGTSDLTVMATARSPEASARAARRADEIASDACAHTGQVRSGSMDLMLREAMTLLCSC